MANFGHLAKLEIKREDTKSFLFHNIKVDGHYATLFVRPAGQVNKNYFNALLKLQTDEDVRAIRAGNIDVMQVDKIVEDDRPLYVEHVIQGWEYMCDEDGVLLDFNKEDCTRFIQGLPEHEFRALRDFCGDISNFDVQIEIETKAKNSPSGSSGNSDTKETASQ